MHVAIPPGSLSQSLDLLARQTGISVGFVGGLPDVRTHHVHGLLEPDEALARLVAGTDLVAVRLDALTFRLEHRAAPPAIVAAGTRHRPHADIAPGDIVVTATKRSATVESLALSLGVVLPDRLSLSARDSDGVIADSDGAFSTNLGPGRNRLFLRGVADSAFNGPTQATVSQFLDDARVSYATPDPDLRLIDIDRVEILRGPQGALYGTGSLGGIIRTVTAAPDPDRWSGLAAAEASVVGHGATGGVIEGMINIPLVSGRLALRAAAYGEQIAGWIDDPSRGTIDGNRVLRNGGRAALRWSPGGDWTATAGFTGQWIEARDSQYSDGTARLAKRTAIAEPHDNDFIAVHLDLHGRLAGADLSSTTAYVTHRVGSLFDAGAVAAARGLPQPLAYDEARLMKLFTEELRLTDPQARHPWVVGIAYLAAATRLDGIFEATGISEVARDDHDHNSELALFGETTRPLLRRLDLRLGLRAFLAREQNEHVEGHGADRDNRHAGVTPSVSVSWAPRDGAHLWIGYASAIRPGGLAQATTGRTFKSDELQNLELGWRIAPPGAPFSLSGAIFGYRWTHLQSDTIGSDGLITTINAGTAHNLGIEASARLALGRLRLDGGFTVQRARLDEPDPLRIHDADRRLPVVPDETARARACLSLAVAGLDGEAYVSGRYVGSARLSFDPLLARETRPFVTADTGLTLGRDGWRGTLAIANLFDRLGDTFAFGNPFSLAVTNQRTPLRPRTISVRIERRF